MKKIINKIDKILTTDVGKLLHKLELWDLFYNVFEFIYRFTLRPFVTIISNFFVSYKKTKVTLLTSFLVFLFSFNFFVYVGSSVSSGNTFKMETGFFSYDYNEDSKIITKETLGGKIVKMKYFYQSPSLEECKIEYEKTLKNVENIYKHLSVTGSECNRIFDPADEKRLLKCAEELKIDSTKRFDENCKPKKTTHKYYSYEVIAEASSFDKFTFKIESLKKSLPYYLAGVVIAFGTILLSPFILLANI